MAEQIVIPVEKADKRYFTIGQYHTSDKLEKNVPLVAAIEPRGLISEIIMQDAAMHIYLRSVVQVTFCIIFAIFFADVVDFRCSLYFTSYISLCERVVLLDSGF